MNIEKFETTLYDMLANILPGYLLVLCFSIIEATYLKTSLFALSVIGEELLIFTIFAYFLGQIGHSLISLLKEKKQPWFSDRKHRLKNYLYDAVCEAAIDSYGLNNIKISDIDRLDSFMLAENYLLVSGEPPGRETLIAREGFLKSSMFGTTVLSFTAIGALIKHGIVIQIEPGQYSGLGFIATILIAVTLIGITLLFRNRMMFFNRLKVNSILLMFLAQYNNQKRKGEYLGK